MEEELPPYTYKDNLNNLWFESGPLLPNYLEKVAVASDLHKTPTGLVPINVREAVWLGREWGGVDSYELAVGVTYYWSRDYKGCNSQVEG